MTIAADSSAVQPIAVSFFTITTPFRSQNAGFFVIDGRKFAEMRQSDGTSATRAMSSDGHVCVPVRVSQSVITVDLVDGAISQRHHEEIAVRSGLNVGADAESGTETKALALGRVELPGV